jgi:hypothetical protein
MLNGPEYHFNKAERGTLDYVENSRDPNKSKSWASSTFHTGPAFLQKIPKGEKA